MRYYQVYTSTYKPILFDLSLGDLKGSSPLPTAAFSACHGQVDCFPACRITTLPSSRPIAIDLYPLTESRLGNAFGVSTALHVRSQVQRCPLLSIGLRVRPEVSSRVSSQGDKKIPQPTRMWSRDFVPSPKPPLKGSGTISKAEMSAKTLSRNQLRWLLSIALQRCALFLVITNGAIMGFNIFSYVSDYQYSLCRNFVQSCDKTPYNTMNINMLQLREKFIPVPKVVSLNLTGVTIPSLPLDSS